MTKTIKHRLDEACWKRGLSWRGRPDQPLYGPRPYSEYWACAYDPDSGHVAAFVTGLPGWRSAKISLLRAIEYGTPPPAVSAERKGIVLEVPGRKTDVKDSEWICQMVAHGLVRPSFVPPPEIRRLRDLTRLRKAQVNERTRAIQRLEKVLQDAGIKLTSVASQAYSKSARAMLEALLAGATDPEPLAELAKGRMRSKIPQLREALANRFDVAHHGVLVAQLLSHIDTLDAAIATLDGRVELMLAPHKQVVERLCTIPGVAVRTAQVMIAECGLDMARFPTVAHFASWAGMCPGHHESAGRRRSGRTRPGPRWLTEALTESAKAASRTKGTYLAAHHAQIRGRRGEPKAIGATRHDILVAYYHIVRDEVPFRELGADWQKKRYSPEHRARRLQRQLEALGYQVTLEQNDQNEEANQAA